MQTTSEKNQQLEEQFELDKKRVAKEILESQGLIPVSRDQRQYVENLLQFWSLPGQTGRHSRSGAPYDEMATEFMYPSISKKDPAGIKGEKKNHGNYVTVVHKDSEELHGFKIFTHTIDFYYPAGSYAIDKEFLTAVVEDQEKYTKELGISVAPPHKIKFNIHLMYPSDKKPEQEFLEMTPTDPNKQILTNITAGEIPFTKDQLREIYKQVDDRNKELRHPGKKYLEIREPSVLRMLNEGLSILPEGSYIKKLSKGKEEQIAKYIYESIRTYGMPNLEDASGYLFEALFQIELPQSDRLQDLLWFEVNRNRSPKGPELDVSSEEAANLNEKYQQNSVKLGKKHADFLVVEEIENRINVSAIIECKSNPSGFIHPDYVRQTIQSVKNLAEFIHTLDDAKKYNEPSAQNTKILIVKPKNPSEPSKPNFTEGFYINIIRSDIPYEELVKVSSVMTATEE